MLRRITVLALVVSLVGAASAAFAQTPPSTSVPAAPVTTVASEGEVPEPPALVVEPDTGLLDGQVAALSGSGWGPVVRDVFFCGELVGDISVNCIVVGQVDATDGVLTGSATLPATFTTPGGTAVDCRMEQCRVLVIQPRGDGVTVPVTFAGVVPGVVPATPSFTG